MRLQVFTGTFEQLGLLGSDRVARSQFLLRLLPHRLVAVIALAALGFEGVRSRFFEGWASF